MGVRLVNGPGTCVRPRVVLVRGVAGALLLTTWLISGSAVGQGNKTQVATATRAPLAADGVTQADRPEVTQHDIIPRMLLHCTVCHGQRRHEADLDLRSKAAMLKGGKSGPAIVPGKPEESLLLQRIEAGEMPPRRRLIEVGVKPMTPAEVEVLTQWIALGAPEVFVEPDVATSESDPLVSEKDRQFWAFQSPRRVAVPPVRSVRRVRNPIDAFILKKLEAKGLTLSREADRLTLMRRAYFDLNGLPPEAPVVEGIETYEELIDRLLASPRYGERWGRYWLDAAGYADSEGKRSADPIRPYAYRYRDYVIRSLNLNKPYDRFLLEQIAGDELVDYESTSRVTPEIYDNLVATGFLRMAPDGTGSDVVNFAPERLEVIADEIDVFGSVVLGLTLKCARCHSHKYDPIPHRDYYRLVDIFKGAYDEHDWLKPAFIPAETKVKSMGRVLPYVMPEERQQWEAHDRKLREEIHTLRTALEEATEGRKKGYFEQALSTLPNALHDDLRKTLAIPPEKRTAVQQYLAEKFEKILRVDVDELKQIDAHFKKTAEKLGEQMKALEAQRRPEPRIRALWDRGEPSPTYLRRRGDHMDPGRLVGPGVPSVLTDGKTPFEVKPPWPGAKKTGRRLALAKWLTKPDHPLTARVVVNRIWRYHFGVGLVKTLDNFGKTGSRPTHPDLLDWLAGEFIRQGWNIKSIHRLIMTSSTYRQSSTLSPQYERLDPENRLLSRMPMKRMDAEVLRDTLLLVAGRLDETRFGPPAPVTVRSDGLVTSNRTSNGWRRSIYIRQRRTEIPTILEVFDLPQMNPNCTERQESTVASQSLHLWNNAMIRELADSFAQRVRQDIGRDATDQIEQIYRIALNRLPTHEEKAIGVQSLSELREYWARHSTGDVGDGSTDAAGLALADYCHTILNSAAFLYID